MFKKITIYIALIFILATLTGCAAMQRFNQRPSREDSDSREVSSVLRFSDVPVPSGFKIKSKESYSFQTDVLRAGILKYTGSMRRENVVQFYKEQMPRYNWQLLNLVEYEKSILNFEKEHQSCIITIEGGTTRTTIVMSVSPKSRLGSINIRNTNPNTK